MKKIIPILLFIAIQKMSMAQSIGIGTTTPDSSAMLDISSNNKGLLLPRIKDTSSIKSPAKGLLIYSNNDNTLLYYDGSQWQNVAPDVINTTPAPGPGMDSLWYRVQDSIVYTYYPYVHINTKPDFIAPQATLQVSGNFLIQGKLKYSNAVPTAAQTYTMNNTATLQTVPAADSVFRIYDPGGTGNYNNNMQGNISVYMPFTGVGVKVSSAAADFGLGSGDTLWIGSDVFPACRTNYTYFFTNTTVNPADFVVPSKNYDPVYFIFRSNADGVNGKGFNFSVTRLYNLSTISKIQATGPALYFNSSNGAFAAGFNADVSTIGTALGHYTKAYGFYSTAMGYSTRASGNHSTATGYITKANGNYSFAAGYNTTADGWYSTAIGVNTTASGERSTAMGNTTTASGFNSTAMGRNTTASGNYSTAMGNSVSTNNQEGSFVIGDNSTTSVMNSPAPNNFRARFANGYRLYTSANYSTSCSLGAGDNAWTTGSDVRTKENFAEVNGEDFLKKISGFHLTSWNYKTQNPAAFRHYGPMAQDFYAAFGNDKYGTIGNDTTINSADFAGVSFIAIQALEKRTQKIEQLEKENTEIKKDNAALKVMLLQLRKEVDALQGVKKENL
jgi:hypothetical protein